MYDAIRHFSEKLARETDPYDLREDLQKGEDIVVIDARTRDAYEEERIPGAISLPHREMNEESTRGFSRDTLYVIYCYGVGCNASTKGALNLARLGFRVKELIGGLEWWKRDGYETEGAGV